MAEKRMFSKQIIDSDAFLCMPLSTQALYFHLNMRADDDGFVDKPKTIQRMVGATEDDLKILIAKRYVLTFESGVIVIKHWRIHNTIRQDRYNQTVYLEEKSLIEIKENKSYTENKVILELGLPNGNIVEPQHSIGKNSVCKFSKDSGAEYSQQQSENKNFVAPSVENVMGYCNEKGINVDAERFIDFYSSKGWMVGKNKMKDWKAAVRNWSRTEKRLDESPKRPSRQNDFNCFPQRKYSKTDYQNIEARLLR